MPQVPLRPCTWPGCGRLTREGRCDKHKTSGKQDGDRWRGSSAERGYGSRWRVARKAFLIEHPWCATCLESGIERLATEVDHVIPHRGDMTQFWDQKNWQSLCHSCHSEKTNREDGGFGNPVAENGSGYFNFRAPKF